MRWVCLSVYRFRKLFPKERKARNVQTRYGVLSVTTNVNQTLTVEILSKTAELLLLLSLSAFDSFDAFSRKILENCHMLIKIYEL